MALSVPHWDLTNPSVNISAFNNVVSAHRDIMVKDTDADQAISELAGSSISIGNTIHRIDPDSFPGLGHVIVENILSISLDEYLALNCVGPLNFNNIPTDPPKKLPFVDPENAYGFRVLVVDYSTPTYQTGGGGAVQNPESGPYFTISRQAHSEVVAIPKDGLEWEKAVDIVPERDVVVKEVRSAFSATILRTDVKLTWHRVSNPDFKTIKTLVGTCNKDPIFDSTPSTALFEGLRDTRQVMYTGDLVWEIEYAFSIREVKFQDEAGNLHVGGWNHYPRSNHSEQASVDFGSADDGSQHPWQKLIFKKTGKPPIPEVEWPANILFAVGA